MPTALAIRAASPADVPTVRRYIQALAAHEGRAGDADITDAQLAEALFGQRPIVEALVLEVEGRRVGYAIIQEQFATFHGRRKIYLEDLYIDPAMRDQGLGAAFMRWLFELARGRGCACVDWACVENNPRAMVFYERLGAKRKNGVLLYRFAVE